MVLYFVFWKFMKTCSAFGKIRSLTAMYLSVLVTLGIEHKVVSTYMIVYCITPFLNNGHWFFPDLPPPQIALSAPLLMTISGANF